MDQVSPKGVFQVKNGKSEQYHHWILRIQVSLDTRFSLQPTIFFFFFDQICPKSKFPVENGIIALVRKSMVVTYYNKLFRMGTERHNNILMSFLLLVVETKRPQNDVVDVVLVSLLLTLNKFHTVFLMLVGILGSVSWSSIVTLPKSVPQINCDNDE